MLLCQNGGGKTHAICKSVADSWLENLVPLEWYKTASAKSILFTHLKFIPSDAAGWKKIITAHFKMGKGNKL